MAITEYNSLKKCTKCGHEKPESMFHLRCGVLRAACKECTNAENRARNRASWQKDPLRAKQKRHEYYLANIERHKELGAIWRENNKDRLKQKSSEWYYKNIDHIRKVRAEYRKVHREERRAAAKKRYQAMPEKYLEYWHTRRALKAASGGNHTPQEIRALYEKQNKKCAICASPLKGKYHADHIYPLKLGGLNTIANIQLLCPACNLRKSSKDPIEFMQELGFLL